MKERRSSFRQIRLRKCHVRLCLIQRRGRGFQQSSWTKFSQKQRRAGMRTSCEYTETVTCFLKEEENEPKPAATTSRLRKRGPKIGTFRFLLVSIRRRHPHVLPPTAPLQRTCMANVDSSRTENSYPSTPTPCKRHDD